MSARELGRVGGQLAEPRAAGKPRPTGGSPPGAAPPPDRKPRTRSRAAPRRHAAAVTARTEADQAVRLAPGILSPRKITIKGAP
jgi:hypothetical protein